MGAIGVMGDTVAIGDLACITSCEIGRGRREKRREGVQEEGVKEGYKEGREYQ